MTINGFILRLESVAFSGSPQEVIRQMPSLANHLQIDVIGDVNGSDVLATPHTDPDDLVEAYEKWRGKRAVITA